MLYNALTSAYYLLTGGQAAVKAAGSFVGCGWKDGRDMNAQRQAEPGSRMERLGLNPWLQIFLTIIAGVIVAVIAWTVIERFSHIIILLIASSLVAYLLGPLVDRLERARLPRIVSILLVYLVIIGVLAVGVILLIGPLTMQLQSLTTTLQDLTDPKSATSISLDQFLQQYGVTSAAMTDLRNRIVDYIGSAGSSLLGGTLAVAAGLVAFVTDIFLILAITFYLLLDGRGMHNRGLRLLPARFRERWFFIEATLNKVLGGYIRGQIIVAVTVGMAAGVGSAVLGVQYPLVIGLLAFLFEFIPMLGPVLGMIPAVGIAFFQSPTLALWVVVYFIVLQQAESNVIVPRVSGHAVGLHPLAVLLALLAGFDLGGLGGALLSVPVAGVLFVLAMAVYTDATTQSELLISKPRTTAYRTLRNVLGSRRLRGGSTEVSTGAGAGIQHGVSIEPVVVGSSTVSAPDKPLVTIAPVPSTNGSRPIAVVAQADGSTEGNAIATQTATAAVATTPAAPAPIPSERLVSIAEDQAQLIARFEADEAEQAAVESEAAAKESAGVAPSDEQGPDDPRADAVEL